MEETFLRFDPPYSVYPMITTIALIARLSSDRMAGGWGAKESKQRRRLGFRGIGEVAGGGGDCFAKGRLAMTVQKRRKILSLYEGGGRRREIVWG